MVLLLTHLTRFYGEIQQYFYALNRCSVGVISLFINCPKTVIAIAACCKIEPRSREKSVTALETRTMWLLKAFLIPSFHY